MAGITDLQAPDPSDAVAWGAWARQQDPATYGWQNQRAIDQYSLPGLKPALEKAGLWNPAWNDFAANPEAYQAGSTGDGENAAWHPAEKNFDLDLSSLAGYTTGDQRSADNTRLGALIDPKGTPVGDVSAFQDGSSSQRKALIPLAFVLGGAAAGGAFGGAAAGAEGGLGSLGAGGVGSTTAEQIALMEANGMTAGQIAAATGYTVPGFTAADLTAMGAAGSNITASGINPWDLPMDDPAWQPNPADYEPISGTPDSTFPEQVVDVNGTAPTESGIRTLPSTIPGGSAPVDSLPAPDVTPATNTTIPSVTDVPIPNVPTTSSGLDGLKDWALKNPLQAISLASIIASKLKGGDPTGGPGTPGGPGTGPQAQMTATPAQGLGRQYVAPPAGYRPGFDPEHRYFTGIGAVGAGGASVPKTTQDTFPPGTQG
jgi:hypothetical protein